MLRKIYKWKELSSDGLLKYPKEYGPHYDSGSVDDYGAPFYTAEEAEDALRNFMNNNESARHDEMVLISVYT